MLSYLQDAYDLHVHTGPDVNSRKLDDIEMCERYMKTGFKGYCIKSHYFCTAERARLMKKLYPSFNPIGAISLNYTAGAMNPNAVDISGRDGAKLVWFPTFDSKNEIDYTFGDTCTYDVMPSWVAVMQERNKTGERIEGIYLLENGNLTKKTKEVMDVIAKRNMVLCTGHVSKAEIAAIVKEAPKHNLKKVVVTHATWSSIALSKEDQRGLAEMGAIIEQCAGNNKTAYGITWEGMYNVIRYVGPENCIISSDCGNVNKPYPDVAMENMAERLCQNGFTQEEVRRMAVINTAMLVEE